MATPRTSSSEPTAAGRFGEAIILGALVVAFISAWFMVSQGARLSLGERALVQIYAAGQLLGLAGVVAGAWLALSRLGHRVRAVLAGSELFAALYGVLTEDLASFLERHADYAWALQAGFAGACLGACVGSAWLGAWLARTRLWPAALVMGVAMAVAHHSILELSYAAFHLVVAVCAALLMGPSLLSLRDRVTSRRAGAIAVAAALLVGVPTWLWAPGQTVRAALLQSPGATVAPLVSNLWSTDVDAELPGGFATAHPEWWRPRTNVPPIAPSALAARPAAPIVVLLTFDALRGDLIESKEWSKRLRNFTKLRRSSLRFERAWSAAPATRQSLSALFLGTYASQQRWERSDGKASKRRKFFMPAKGQGPHFPLLLQRAGVDALNIVGYSSLVRGSGITEGFGRQRELKSYAPSEDIVSAVLEELAARPNGPLFVYSHNMDAHAPYNRGRRKGTQLERYQGEVEMVDRALGALLAGLRELGLSDRLYLIVSSDHGEAFYEHGRRFHAQTVYDEMIRVPLYLSGPGIKPRRVRGGASVIDLGPTVLDIFGQPTPGHYMGQSLVPLFAGGKARLTRPLAVDSNSSKHVRGVLFEDRYKAMEHVKSGVEEVYDLKTDPGEKVNLAETPQGKRYVAAARAFFRIHTPPELRTP